MRLGEQRGRLQIDHESSPSLVCGLPVGTASALVYQRQTEIKAPRKAEQENILDTI